MFLKTFFPREFSSAAPKYDVCSGGRDQSMTLSNLQESVPLKCTKVLKKLMPIDSFEDPAFTTYVSYSISSSIDGLQFIDGTVLIARFKFTNLLADSGSPFFSSFQLWPAFLSAFSLSFEIRDLNQPRT